MLGLMNGQNQRFSSGPFRIFKDGSYSSPQLLIALPSLGLQESWILIVLPIWLFFFFPEVVNSSVVFPIEEVFLVHGIRQCLVPENILN